MLEEPTLTFLRVDERATLQFGHTAVAIAGPFELGVDGVTHRLDPRRADQLAPLLSLYPGTVRWLWTSPDGELRGVFEHGAWLRVGPDGPVASWSVTGQPTMRVGER